MNFETKISKYLKGSILPIQACCCVWAKADIHFWLLSVLLPQAGKGY